VAIIGFTSYGFDAVVKFGGSLLIDPSKTAAAIGALEGCFDLGKSILVIPGGGPTDKTIEAIDKARPLHPNTHHHACARAQDQTGLIICDPAFSSRLSSCENLSQARQHSASGRIPVLLPSKIIFDVDPFEKTWEITSDGIALWFSWLVGANSTFILTNVDGIFKPGSNFSTDQPEKSVDVDTLRQWGHTAVDRCVPEFLAARGGLAWVGNGSYADRLPKALADKPTVGTFIVQ
jgi:aspartokinase-like uncharacterized kinase